MSSHTLPTDREGYETLAELAYDLHWSWDHATDKVWRLLDPELWELTHNPALVLQTVSADRIDMALADAFVRQTIDELAQVKRQKTKAPAWFQQNHAAAPLQAVAYFSMEFMLSEGLPIYAGGLGNVAGDHLKAASDLGVPVVGVGLLYQQGYSRQVIHRDGSQQNIFPYNEPGMLPIKPLRFPNGEWLRIEIKLPGYSVWLRTWQVQVGRIPLYLLDSNDPANFPVHRGITGELYGGGPEIRLFQELILGIGGWRLLKSLGIRPEVCHLNEGHAAFVVLERAHDLMRQTGQSFEVALAATRAGNLFTTHTAVAAGFDHFSPALIETYLHAYATEALGITLSDLLALGRIHPKDASEDFHTAYLALKGCCRANAVSRLHGAVSRRLFAGLFPRWPVAEVPIGQVTNGVHMPGWDSPEADRLWTEACGKARWTGNMESLAHNIRCLGNDAIWKFRMESKATFLANLRARYRRQLATSGMPSAMEGAKELFEAGVLTLGFARRFAAYKRPNLLLHDPDRLCCLLNNPQKPVQLVLAGKAHPGDPAGQLLIQEWFEFINRFGLHNKVVFLSDYDMLLTEQLVQGVDVWINTPRRPWEACGTSGMKVLVNGGLHLSVLDGWWDEAWTPQVGWAIGNRQDYDDGADQDARDAAELYETLEQQVIPEYYARNEQGIPQAWVARIRESMATLTPRYSATRSVQEYTEGYYLPLAAHYRERSENKAAKALELLCWQKDFSDKWKQISFGEPVVESREGLHHFTISVFPGKCRPEEIRVELFANGENGQQPEKYEMKLLENTNLDSLLYEAQVNAGRPPTDFTARIFPRNPDLLIPLEFAPILWQR